MRMAREMWLRSDVNSPVAPGAACIPGGRAREAWFPRRRRQPQGEGSGCYRPWREGFPIGLPRRQGQPEPPGSRLSPE